MEDNKKDIIEQDGIENKPVENTMEDYFLRYSMSVIVDRALPDVRDGLKPVNRRILYTMNKNGWKAPHATVKSARTLVPWMAMSQPLIVIPRLVWTKLVPSFLLTSKKTL